MITCHQVFQLSVEHKHIFYLKLYILMHNYLCFGSIRLMFIEKYLQNYQSNISNLRQEKYLNQFQLYNFQVQL
jgi:hypothetical protein